ncbi:MAG: GNAT family N-acetyltransferase [Bacteroidetes bacterium GWA2_30_7]|nr:MAG: GNAT family N-acetyltransferase [Bacteroidetes bacterium GWA2_30_7]
MQFTLRPWNINDLDSLVRYANNYKIAKNMSDGFPHPYTIESGKTFIENASKQNPVHYFAIDINREAVGAIGFMPQTDIHRKNAELGYWLAESFWGKGIIPNAIKEIVEIAFKNFDINRIFARPFGSNLASQKVLEKAGFKLEARFEKSLIKNGEYEDELVYAIRKE